MTGTEAGPVHERKALHGLVAHELRLPCGDRLLVAEWGSQVVSWVAAGRERLYLSPLSRFDGQAAIRGGIPVCWPQFSGRGPLPRHGWVRQSRWSLSRVDLDPGAPRLVFEIRPANTFPAAHTQPWAQDCRLELDVTLAPGSLSVCLAVFNQGIEALPFTGALHTYLSLDDADSATVSGWPMSPALEGWDAVSQSVCRAEPQVALRGEIDRILPAAPGPLLLRDGARGVQIGQSGWEDTVLWNPGTQQCAALADMPNGGERFMACVEAAQALEPASVPPGEVWRGTQTLTVVTPR